MTLWCIATQPPPSGLPEGGVGKIRHLETTDLWVQEVARSGRVALVMIPGVDNPADVLTRFVDKPLMQNMLTKMGMLELKGRAKCTPAIAAKKVAQRPIADS